MKNLMKETMDKLNEELIRRGIVYDEPEVPNEYNECAYLETVYEWGFSVVMYCDVIDPVMSFYDWTFQRIVSIDCDEYTTHRIVNGWLYVEERHAFTIDKTVYSLRVSDGAPVHVEDIEAIGYNPPGIFADDERFYALKNGWIYFQKAGEDMIRYDGDVTIDDFVAKGYELVQPKDFQPNVDFLNEVISRHIHLKYRR